ncbi:hypothetical protein [Actinosynnema pretiosum]|uniref:AbiEi antitoxin C-terminal domain-containing protein n=1 Tax=Actinosynnema pretiosum TaxID=42197 RepID=A0A290Z0U1_9PSEU|nr:hypothetical protein [Actinosynnema pretiosum]ATE52651.1 hypothetical protein CNX65_04590 [Actinosynnema pretiosum]
MTSEDVMRVADLRAAGVPNHVIEARCRPGGRWQRVLPGVLLLSPEPPTDLQRLRAAQAYAGPGSVITGVAALRAQGVRGLPDSGRVHVLQPESQRLTGYDYVFLERTSRLPHPVRHHGLSLAPPPRAVLDAARREPNPLRLHHLLAAVVRAGLCTAQVLLTELDAGSRRGTAAPRATLRTLLPTT